MKEAFLRDMRLMYPQGLDPSEKHQWRDMIRIFSMGWADGLESADADDKLQAWVNEFRPISDMNWWPDDSWKWW